MISSFGIEVRTRGPSGATTTRSSIRTPKLARHVDARLDGDDVAGLQRALAAGREPRRLVHLEPDAVAEPVAELLALAGRLDHARARRRRPSRTSAPAATASSAAACASRTSS